MRLPKDLSGRELARRLLQFGYEVTRQKGSHIRLTTVRSGEHHVTVPDHAALRAGTLNAVLSDVAAHAGLSRDEVLQMLFGV